MQAMSMPTRASVLLPCRSSAPCSAGRGQELKTKNEQLCSACPERRAIHALTDLRLGMHPQMVAMVEPQMVDEPDRLRAERDRGDLQVVMLAGRRGDERGRDPQQHEAETVDRQDEGKPAFARHHPPPHAH